MTARQDIRGLRTTGPSNNMLPFGQSVDDAEGQSKKEQAGIDSSIRSVRRYRVKNGVGGSDS